MKRTIVFLLLISIHLNIYSQINLISNNSFEEYSSCPISGGEIWKANGWYGINSVEYFHECAVPYGLNVPYSLDLNFQYAKTGVAYAGLCVFHLTYDLTMPFPYKEWPATRIQTQLEAQKKYCGGFYLNKHNYTNVAIRSFGIYFSADSIFDAPFGTEVQYPIPQIKIDNGFITDTLNWVLMEGVFTAQGNEKYMIIGSFLPSDSVTYQIMGIPQSMEHICPFGGRHISYYFIDDVSLYELNKLPTAQNHAYNCAANTVTLKADTGFNFRWYYLPDTVNVLSTADTFVVDASTAKHVLLRATLCSTEFTDTVFVPKLDCTGIENNALAQGASLFPNPASNMATFSLQGMPPPGTSLHLTDLNGRELRSFAVTGKTTEMDVSGLANGVYFVSYRYKENVIWKGKLCKFGD
jgi:hypothetical protein